MAALKITAKVPEKFDQLKQELEGDKGFCAVLAVAAITGISAKEAQAALAAAGRKPRCGTARKVTKKALEDLGYKVHCHGPSFLRRIINEYPGRASNLQNVTTHHPRLFPQVWGLKPDMLMFSQRHVSAFVNGVVVDWAIAHSKRVVEVWTIEKKGA